MANLPDLERYRGDTVPDQFTFTDTDVATIAGFSFRLTLNSEFNPANQDNEQIQFAGVVTDAVNKVVEFSPADQTAAEALVPGVYFYDIQLYNSSGVQIKTLGKAVYTILQDVTKELT